MSDVIKNSLKDDENITLSSSTSLSGILAIWLTLPIITLVTYLPIIIAVSSRVNRTLSFLQIFGFDGGDAISELGFWAPLLTFAGIMLFILIAVWVLLSLVKTYLNSGFEIACTNYRVIGKAKEKFLDSKWADVKNAYVSRSWLGKIFNYGSITVLTKRGSYTFKNIANAEKIKSVIFSQIQSDT